MNLRIMSSIAPVAIFWALSRTDLPSWVAIAAGFVASAVVFYLNRNARLIGALAAFGFAVVTVSAIFGLIWDSEKAYLASGPVADFLFVPLYLGSIAIGKPLIGGITRELFPAYARLIPVNAPVFRWLSLAWAGYDIFHGALRVYLLAEMSTGQYIIWSRVLSWPFTAALIGLTIWAVMRASRQAEGDGPAAPSDAPDGRGWAVGEGSQPG